MFAAPLADVPEPFGPHRHQAAVPGGYIFMGGLLGALAVQRVPGIGASRQDPVAVVLRLHKVFGVSFIETFTRQGL